jgi:methylenetetrahydrofolate--tRNA-(uracil-5-)-methyltransferase
VFLAGQLVGVEGYVESAATGILAGINATRLLAGEPLLVPPPATSLGSLIAYVTERSRREFQPMNANYGLFPALDGGGRGRERRVRLAERALAVGERWMTANGLGTSVPKHGEVSRGSLSFEERVRVR